MDILNTFTLKSNRKIKINFAGGDLSSDVYFYCYEHGYETLSDYSVLLRSRQDGEFH